MSGNERRISSRLEKKPRVVYRNDISESQIQALDEMDAKSLSHTIDEDDNNNQKAFYHDSPENQQKMQQRLLKYAKKPYSVFDDRNKLVRCKHCKAKVIPGEKNCCLEGKYILPKALNPQMTEEYRELLEHPEIQKWSHILNRHLSPAIVVTEPSNQNGGSLTRPLNLHMPQLAVSTTITVQSKPSAQAKCIGMRIIFAMKTLSSSKR